MELLSGNKLVFAIFVVHLFSEVISQPSSLPKTKEFRRIQSKSKFKEDEDGKIWRVVNEETSSPCISLKGNIEFEVDSGHDNHPNNVIKVPAESTSEGSCLTLWSDYQDIKLKWSPGNNASVTNSIYFGFATQWKSEYSDLVIGPGDYALNTVTVVYHRDESSNMTLVSYSVSDFIAFQTPMNKSYSCPSSSVLQVGELTIMFSDFKFQAFKNKMDLTDFNESIQCGLNKDESKDERNLFLSILQWVLISLFAAGLIGAALVIAVGLIRKHMDTMNIGYTIVEDL